MQRDARVYVWDALRAADAIAAFVSGKTWEDYQTDLQLRSAVERQFQIIGEALNLLARTDPDTAARIPDLRRIVDFRNVLVHGYAEVRNEIVWAAVQHRLPGLRAVLVRLLGEP